MLQVRETYVNKDEKYQFGDTDWFEPHTDNIKRLFQLYQKEYGQCVSSMFIDGQDGKPIKIGWVFEKKEQYEGTGKYGRPAEFYIRETWVELRDRKTNEEMFAWLTGHFSPDKNGIDTFREVFRLSGKEAASIIYSWCKTRG
jgi:hypothetical protein